MKFDSLTISKGSFKVLILPIRNLSSGTITDYGRLIQDRLENINVQENLGAFIYYHSLFKTPNDFNDSSRLKLLEYSKSDIVIWGDFASNNGVDYFSIKYASQKWKQFNSTGTKLSLFSVQQFSDGHMQGDLDFILRYISGIINYKLSNAGAPSNFTMLNGKVELQGSFIMIDKLKSALSSFSSLIKNPSETLVIEGPIYHFVGICHLLLNNGQKSIYFLEKYLTINPKDPYAWSNLALAYALIGDLSNAISSNTKALKNFPQKELIFFDRGLNYYMSNDFEGLKRDCRSALSVNPRYDLAYYGLSLAFESERNYAAALKFIDSAIQISPENGFLYFQKSSIFRKLKRFLDANYSLGIAIVKDAKNYIFYEDRAENGIELVLVDSLRASLWEQQVLLDIEVMKNLKPESNQALVLTGKLYSYLGKHYEALKQFTTILQNDPSNYSALFGRHRSYFHLKDFTKSVEDASMLITLYPKDYTGYMLRGESYLLMGKFDSCINDLTIAIGLKPGLGGLYLNRGNAYCLSKKYNQCKKDIRTAAKLGEALTRSQEDALFKKM